jgi:hypothetical protein
MKERFTLLNILIIIFIAVSFWVISNSIISDLSNHRPLTPVDSSLDTNTFLLLQNNQNIQNSVLVQK